MGDKKKITPSSFHKGVLLFDKENWKPEFDEWNNQYDNSLNQGLSTGEIVKVYAWEYIMKDRLLQMEEELNQYFRIVDTIELSKIHEVKDIIESLYSNKVNKVRNLLFRYFEPYEDGQEWIKNLFLCAEAILCHPKQLIEIIEKTPDNLTKVQRMRYQYLLIEPSLPNPYSVRMLNFPLENGCFNLSKLADSHIATNDNKKPLLNLFIFLEQFIVELQDFNRYKFDLIKSRLFIFFFSSMMKYRALYKMAYGDFISLNIDRTIKEVLSLSKEGSQIKHTGEVTQNKKKDMKRIDEILRELFPYELDVQLNQFKEALLNPKKPGFLEVKYIGTKENLYKQLGKLRKAGVARGIIATVFSEKCKWKKNQVSDDKALRYEELYRKMR